MNDSTDYDLDDCLRALADETRQRILALLQEREMSVGELNACFAVTQPTISYHLAILRRAHLISPRRAGQQTFYHANQDCVGECCREILNRFTPPQVGKPAGG